MRWRCRGTRRGRRAGSRRTDGPDSRSEPPGGRATRAPARLHSTLVTIDDEWPVPESLAADRLVLEPLRVEHAEEMAVVLDDPALHTYTGGTPATLEELRSRYGRQVAGPPADESERWLNWIVRRRADERAIGYVQATITSEATGPSAEVAWVIGTGYQGCGYAVEAAGRAVGWLREQDVETIVAHVHPEHLASMAVARRIGLHPTDRMVDGEIRWEG